MRFIAVERVNLHLQFVFFIERCTISSTELLNVKTEDYFVLTFNNSSTVRAHA